MAIFTDIGSLQDRSFNQLANEGRIAIGKELGIQTRVYVTKSGNGAHPERARRGPGRATTSSSASASSTTLR